MKRRNICCGTILTVRMEPMSKEKYVNWTASCIDIDYEGLFNSVRKS